QARAIDVPEGMSKGLVGGFVGYLGYECKADCGSPNTHSSDVPDAVQLFANRLVAIDHIEGRTHLLAVCRGDEPEAEQWLEEAARVIEDLLAAPCSQGPQPLS